MCKQVFRDFAKELTEDLILEAKEKGYSIEDLAELIGVSKHTILNYFYDEKIPSLPAFVGLWRKTRPEKTLKKLATWSGFIVIKLPEVKEPFTLLTSQTAKVMRENADVVEVIGKSIKDGKITNEEVKVIEKEIDEAIEELLKLKIALKGRIENENNY